VVLSRVRTVWISSLELWRNVVVVKGKLVRSEVLEARVGPLGDRIKDVIQYKSLVGRVHVGQESDSVVSSKRSVLIGDSPWADGEVFAGVVIGLSLNSLNWDVDRGNSDVRSIGLQPLDSPIVDWLFASISLELNLEDKAITSGSKSIGKILGQVIGGSHRLVKEGLVHTITGEHSVLGSRRGKWIWSVLKSTSGPVWHEKDRRNTVVHSLLSCNCCSCRISGSKERSSSVTSSIHLSSGHDCCGKDSLISRGKNGESTELKVEVIVILETRNQLHSSNVEQLESKSLVVSGISCVLKLL